MVSSKTLAVAAALSTASAVSAFDAQSKTNVAVYYGQGYAQPRLSEFCQDPALDIINIGFVNVFPEQGTAGWPGSNFGNQCDGTTFQIGGESTELLSGCHQIVEDIPICQAAGKKVFLSLGGAYPATQQLLSEETAIAFADFLWLAFGPVNQTWVDIDGPRPFKDVVVDGFDFDIEHNGGFGYADMVNRFREHFAEVPDRTFYISGAPQCPIPDAQLSDAIANSPFDFVWVQFYNTLGCSAMDYVEGNKPGFNYDAWVDVIKKSANPNAKLYVGLPASETVVNPGFYLTPEEVEPLVEEYMKKYPETFGGIMLWEATASELNQINGGSYADNMKSILTGCAPTPSPTPSSTTPVPSSTATPSSTPVSSSTTSSSTVSSSSSAVPSSSPVSSSTTSSTVTPSSSPVTRTPTSTPVIPTTTRTRTSSIPVIPTTTRTPTQSPSSSPTKSPSASTPGSSAPVPSSSSSSSTSCTDSTTSGTASPTTTSSSTSVSSSSTSCTDSTTTGQTVSPTTSSSAGQSGTTTTGSGITSGPVSTPTTTTADSTTYTTVIVTSYTSICPTGFTTITTTYTTTYCPGNTATATATTTQGPSGPGATSAPAPPEGWTTTVTVCTQCAATPTTVTLTLPAPTTAAPVVPTTTATLPAGYTTTVTVCTECGPEPTTVTVTVPIIAVPTGAPGKPTGRPVHSTTSRPIIWGTGGVRPSSSTMYVRPSSSGSHAPVAPTTTPEGVSPVFTGAAPRVVGWGHGAVAVVASLVYAFVM